MVLPDGAGGKGKRSSPLGGIIAGVGAVTLLLGVALIAALTSPGAPPTSVAGVSVEPVDPTTFEMSKIVTGAQPVWERAMAIEDVPRPLVVHDGTVYLFTATGEWWGRDPGPISAMASQDGLTWVDLGEVLAPEGRVTSLVSTPEGLAGVEDVPGGFDLLTSEDGANWESEAVTAEGVPDGLALTATAVAGAEGQLAVAGYLDVDTQSVLERAVERTGIDIGGASNWGIEPSANGTDDKLVIWGPLGLVAQEIGLSALSLTDEERALLVRAHDPPPGAPVWYFHEELGWQHSLVPDAQWIEELWFDGPRLVALGWTRTGVAEWHSFDGGINWEAAQRSSVSPRRVVSWPGGLVAVDESQSVELAVPSKDGMWEQVGLRGRFPSQMGWYVDALAGGEGGIGLAAETWIYEPEWTTSFHPVTLVDGEAELEVDLNSGRLVLRIGGDVDAWSIGSTSDGIEVDMTRELVVFHDTESGEPLADFSFEELAAAETEYWAQEPSPDTLQAMAFSSDLENWIVQDVATALGEGREIVDLAITGRHIVALVGQSQGWSPQSDEGFELWSAPIP